MKDEQKTKCEMFRGGSKLIKTHKKKEKFRRWKNRECVWVTEHDVRLIFIPKATNDGTMMIMKGWMKQNKMYNMLLDGGAL